MRNWSVAKEPLDIERLFRFFGNDALMKGTAVFGRLLVGGLVAAILIGSPSLGAQLQRPLTPLPPNGLRVAPFFDGWYRNTDGTVTLSFGYSNLNLTELVEIPLGPDNFIAPAEFDGRQPTSFPPPGARDEDGPPTRRQRERGVFTVTVPVGFRDDVVWTLVNQERTFSVPGNAQSSAYQLQWPMALGSQPPLVRFSPDGPAGRGPTGIDAEPISASVDTPLPLTVWIHDDSVREEEPLAVRRRQGDAAALNVTWFKHAGPGSVVFSPHTEPIAEAEGMATTTATFEQPGEYVIRVRADSFGRIDSSAGNQCCWTNGYVKVTVTS
ncbi:MAG: hypothetical protein ABGY72_10155 [bacterium]